MSEIEKAICVLECMAIDLTGDLAGLLSKEPMADVLKQRIVAINTAQAALRDKLEREKNEPLTLDELRQMDGQPAWWDDGEGSCWGIVSVNEFGPWAGTPFFRGRWRGVNFEYDIKKRGMKLYRHPLNGQEPGRNV